MFLSVVLPVRNQGQTLEPVLRRLCEVIEPLVTDFELIVVDNASSDDSLALLRRLVGIDGIPNLQVYGLVRAVEADAAAWAGVECALGDQVVVLDPQLDDLACIPGMLEAAGPGIDIVFAVDRSPRPGGAVRALANRVFTSGYRLLTGVELGERSTRFRLVSRPVIDYVLRHKQPVTTYRFLAAASGFRHKIIEGSPASRSQSSPTLTDDLRRAGRLLVSTTHAPIRLVSILCLFGAGANLGYSAYVIAVAMYKADVAPGWVSLSLMQSGMFFLISLVLLVIGEYIGYAARQAGGGPAYHVAHKMGSARLDNNGKTGLETAAQVFEADVPAHLP